MVCDKWQNSFEEFYRYMGDRPKGMSIERIDVSKGYEPGNVKWASKEEQNNNRRTTIRISRDGGVVSLKQYCAIKHLSYTAIRSRVLRGWSIDAALDTPVKRHTKHQAALRYAGQAATRESVR